MDLEIINKELENYNVFFKARLYVKKPKEDQDQKDEERYKHLHNYCKKLNSLFLDFYNVYKCIPEETWKMYNDLGLTGLQEQEFLKAAKDRLDAHLKNRPKLLVKGKVSNARKSTLRKISESSNTQSSDLPT